MKVYNHGKETTEKEIEKIIGEQIGLVIARELIDSSSEDWDDIPEEERIPFAAELAFTLFEIYGHFTMGWWEGEGGEVISEGWRVYPYHFGLDLVFERERCDIY